MFRNIKMELFLNSQIIDAYLQNTTEEKEEKYDR